MVKRSPKHKRIFETILSNHILRWTEYVRPACIPAMAFEVAAGANCVVVGWGKGSKNMLNMATLPIWDHEKYVNLLISTVTLSRHFTHHCIKFNFLE